MPIRKNKSTKKCLKWSIEPVKSQQTINCEDVTLKVKCWVEKIFLYFCIGNKIIILIIMKSHIYVKIVI